MVLAYAVTNEGKIPIHYTHSYGDIMGQWTHAARCCGHCCRETVLTDKDCRCINNESYSTTCRCVFLSDRIFRTSNDLRAETLRPYWKNNVFLIAGYIWGDIVEATSSLSELTKIRKLVISALSYFLRPFDSRCWRLALAALRANPELRIEILLSCRSWCRHGKDKDFECRMCSRVTDFENPVTKLGLRLRAWGPETAGTETLLIDHMR